jgi:hypothetical protein
MTTPSILSDKATARDAKVDRSGAVRSQKAVATVPDTTASATVIGMIRFEGGFSLDQLVVKSDDLTASTALLLHVGYVYDDDTTYSNDADAFFQSADIAQDAGSLVWPVADGRSNEGFVADAPGYIAITTAAAATDAAGDVHVMAVFHYDED